MATALVLQNFNLRLDDPSYETKVKQTLTIKPEGFYMRSTLRDGIDATRLQNLLSSSGENVEAAMTEGIKRMNTGVAHDLKPLTILYGSNTGTCQSLAQKLSVEARRYGFYAEVKDMDAGVDALNKESPTVIITASYEGQPPDNASQFVKWLEMLDGGLDGVEYAVFGCGHSEWVSTFQRIPNLVDELMEKHGGKRLAQRGFANAAEGEIFGSFDTWTHASLWPAVAPSSAGDPQAVPTLEVEMSTQDRSSYLRQDVKPGKVVAAKVLTAPGEPVKRHLEVKLPEDMTYETGDYLAVLPLNPRENVRRVQRHFELPSDATLTIKPGAATFLPTGVTLSVEDLLKGFVELSLPATKRDVEVLVRMCKHEAKKSSLQTYADNDLNEKHISILDLLEQNPSIEIAFSTFLSMLPALRPRYYSISSSPLADLSTCVITYGIIHEAAKSGLGNYIGVTGAYLSGLKAGDEVLVSVRATNKYFHIPADCEKTPLLMFAAGSGLAPFRGFIQERAQQIAAGRKLAPALLFLGCRSPTKDRLYGKEMDKWAQAGAVDIRYAFSREPEKSEGCRYVQDRMLKDAKDVRRIFREGAKCFTCSGPGPSEGIADAAVQIWLDGMKEIGKEMTAEEAKEWFRQRRNERFVVDVFA
jgi:cytochrome P450 / NADPH-cytochrome P450 reductase